jgi:hypothetical protein
MTGGSERRSRAASSFALKLFAVIAISRVGRTDEGADPPPISDSPSTQSALISLEPISDTKFSARSLISAFDSCIILNAGIALGSPLM